jgi:eukaryotic-like serine/threonine-protein kinase
LAQVDPRKLAMLFERVRMLSPAERRPYLERECADDPDLREQVLNLVLQDEQASQGRNILSASRTDPRGLETTVDLSSVERPSRSALVARPPVKAKLVVGSGPSPTVVLQHQLHDRLRMGVLIIFFGFTVFLASDLWSEKYADGLMNPTLVAHVVVVGATVLAALVLWCKKRLALKALRRIEWMLLSVGIIFCAVYEAGELREWEQWSSALGGYSSSVLELTSDGCVLRWFAFIVFYGIFVLNTWRRCVGVVCLLALCPIAVALAVGFWDGWLGQFGGGIGDMVVWVGVALAIAIGGSYKITLLSEQATEARKLGQYSLKESLGSGGMGVVYLAHHPRLRRPCAIKLIRPEQARDRITESQFDAEVQAAAGLTHPNSVQIFDYGVAEDGTLFYAMEYLPGPTFQQLVREHGPLPPERTIYFLRQVCAALREAHGLGLIHRDIKPGNLIVSDRGGISDFVKLLDYGLVQNVLKDGPNDPSLGGRVAGTPAYMSPEQASPRSSLDGRTDIYSLGAVGYFLLTGHSPFENASPFMVAHPRQPVPPSRVRGQVAPDDLDAVIMRCLLPERDNRFPDVASLDHALAACDCASRWTESEAARWWQEHPGGKKVTSPRVPPTPLG